MRLKTFILIFIILCIVSIKGQQFENYINTTFDGSVHLYDLRLGDTLVLTETTREKKEIFFKKNGKIKGNEIIGTCGNISRFEKWLVSNGKWKKLGYWKQINDEGNKIKIEIGRNYLILEIVESEDSAITLAVIETNE